MRRIFAIAIGFVLVLLPSTAGSARTSPELGRVAILYGHVGYFGPGQGDRPVGTISYVTAPLPTSPPSASGPAPQCVPPSGSNQLIYQELGGKVQ